MSETGISTVLTGRIQEVDAKRASTVRMRLLALKSGVVEQFLEFGQLLREAKEGEYHQLYGFGDFGEWSLAELEVSERQAYYCISVITGAEKLGISLEELKKLRVSQLKEIFSLDPEQYGEQMKQLVAGAESMSVEATKDAVSTLKAETEGIEPMAMFTIKVPISAKTVIRQALDKIREADGEMSDGRALELICVEYLN